MQKTFLKYLAFTLLVLAILWTAYSTGAKHGAQRVQVQWDAQTIQRQKVDQQETERREQIETALQVAADKRIQEKQREIANLNTSVSRLFDQLRKRADRPSDTGVPQVTGTESNGPGCTGGQLYREDGEFLTREAARAEKLRLGLLECRAAYQDATSAIDNSVATPPMTKNTHKGVDPLPE